MKNECGGLFNKGKCVLTQEEGRELGMNIKSKRVVCAQVDKYGECNMTLNGREE